MQTVLRCQMAVFEAIGGVPKESPTTHEGSGDRPKIDLAEIRVNAMDSRLKPTSATNPGQKRTSFGLSQHSGDLGQAKQVNLPSGLHADQPWPALR